MGRRCDALVREHGRDTQANPDCDLAHSWALGHAPFQQGCLSHPIFSHRLQAGSLDKTSAGTPVPVGSKAFTGELGRQEDDGVREGERRKKGRGRAIEIEGEIDPPTEKNRMRQRKSEPRGKRLKDRRETPSGRDK